MRERPRVGPKVPEDWHLVEVSGPGLFTSRVTYELPDSSRYVWQSRHARKGAGPVLGRKTATGSTLAAASRRNPWLRFWAPRRLAWWVAVLFMVGSALFVAGAVGSLVPWVFDGEHAMSVFAETCYFFGAVLYTLSIYGQVLESINADDTIDANRLTHAPRQFRWFAFEPRRIAFLTPFVLLIGSLVYNYETTVAGASTFALLPELLLWTTSLLGGLLFLVSSVLQLAEAGHRYLSIEPRDVSWWVAVFFILGSVGFIIGSLPGMGTPGLPTAEQSLGAEIVKLGFLGGGIAFFIGSYLMLPELFIHLRAQGRDE